MLTCYRLYIRTFQKSRTFSKFLILSSFAFGKLSFPSAANSFSLSHLHLFVKNFFRSFSKFFVPDSHPMCFPRENAPLYYHPHPRLSTLFSPFFRLFLCLLSLVLISAPEPKIQSASAFCSQWGRAFAAVPTGSAAARSVPGVHRQRKRRRLSASPELVKKSF